MMFANQCDLIEYCNPAQAWEYREPGPVVKIGAGIGIGWLPDSMTTSRAGYGLRLYGGEPPTKEMTEAVHTLVELHKL